MEFEKCAIMSGFCRPGHIFILEIYVSSAPSHLRSSVYAVTIH